MNNPPAFPPAPIWLLNCDAFPDDESVGVQLLADDDGADRAQYTAAFTFDHHAAMNARNYQAIEKTREATTNNSRFYLTAPTASRIPSNALHPWFYVHCVGIPNLERLAQSLQAPENWRQRIDMAIQLDSIREDWYDVCNQTDDPESMVESNFITFVKNFSRILGRTTRTGRPVHYGVGGLLAGDPDCAYIGVTDHQFVQRDQVKFITEAKTCVTYPLHDAWYRRSRGAQSLGALYYTDLPVLLYSQSAFKVLLKARDSDIIHVFPVDEEHDQVNTFFNGDVASMDFVYAVGLLILSGLEEPIAEPLLTPVKPNEKLRVITSVQKYQQVRRSSRIAAHSASGSGSSSSRSRPVDTRSQSAMMEMKNMIPQKAPTTIFRLTPEEVEAAFKLAGLMESSDDGLGESGDYMPTPKRFARMEIPREE